MGLGQMMLALLATVLLSVLILNINKNSIVMESSINEYKIRELELSLAQSIIDEAQNKKFDESNIGFTAPGSLGPEAGESFAVPTSIDDFDDFDGFRNTATSDTFQLYTELGKTTSKAVFRDTCIVKYVDIADLRVPVNYATSYKRLEVRVWSNSFLNPYTNKPDTVKLFTICGDWNN